MSYESPIKLLFPRFGEAICDMAKKQDEMVFDAVARVGAIVDKGELIRALKYDRGQYDKGFNDGIMAAAEELVRCKDCVHRPKTSGDTYGIDVKFPWGSLCPLKCEDPYYNQMMADDFFCGYGERRSDEDY